MHFFNLSLVQLFRIQNYQQEKEVESLRTRTGKFRLFMVAWNPILLGENVTKWGEKTNYEL